MPPPKKIPPSCNSESCVPKIKCKKGGQGIGNQLCYTKVKNMSPEEELLNFFLVYITLVKECDMGKSFISSQGFKTTVTE